MRHLPSVCRLLAVAAVGWLVATPAEGQSTAVGLSTLRAQRFGNDDLAGIYTPQAADRFAESLAVGDFNGDGADDLATGMPLDNGFAASPLEDSGSVVVRYSVRGSGLTNNPPQVYLRQQSDPPEADDFFGFSLAACDFDDNGVDDLAVGAPREDYLGKGSAGIVHVYYGTSADPLSDGGYFAESTPGVPEDVEDADYFGWSLACGDFDADGFDDLAVGVPGETWNGGFFSMGNVVVVPGSAFGLAYAESLNLGQDGPGMAGEADGGDAFGWSVETGDFDADGYADLAIGVPGEASGGAVQVVFGGPGGLGTSNVLLEQGQAGGGGSVNAGFGNTLAAGDFDGDGADDLAVGAPLADRSSAVDSGEVRVLFGAAGGFDLARTVVLGEETVFGLGTSEADDSFGLELASGDFDRDGRDDLAIGHPGETIAGPGDGAVTVLSGASNGIDLVRRRQLVGGVQGIPGNLTQSGEQLGYSLAAGDFDGDGHDDLAIGSPDEDAGGVADVGTETVLYGVLFADGVESGNTSLWPQNFSWPNGNKVRATAAAQLGPLGSRFGLQVDLFDPTVHQPAAPTYVRVGPEAGFANERALSGQFFIDPHDLTMSATAGFNILQMMAFGREASGTGVAATLAFDLVRTPTNWAILANYRSDAVNGLRFAGSGTIAEVNRNDPSQRNVLIEFEWRAGDPGQLTMWRTRFVGGAPDAEGRVLLFSNPLPDAGSAAVNQVFVGMVFGQDRGTYGSLYLDEISFRR